MKHLHHGACLVKQPIESTTKPSMERRYSMCGLMMLGASLAGSVVGEARWRSGCSTARHCPPQLPQRRQAAGPDPAASKDVHHPAAPIPTNRVNLAGVTHHRSKVNPPGVSVLQHWPGSTDEGPRQPCQAVCAVAPTLSSSFGFGAEHRSLTPDTLPLTVMNRHTRQSCVPDRWCSATQGPAAAVGLLTDGQQAEGPTQGHPAPAQHDASHRAKNVRQVRHALSLRRHICATKPQHSPSGAARDCTSRSTHGTRAWTGHTARMVCVRLTEKPVSSPGVDARRCPIPVWNGAWWRQTMHVCKLAFLQGVPPARAHANGRVPCLRFDTRLAVYNPHPSLCCWPCVFQVKRFARLRR